MSTGKSCRFQVNGYQLTALRWGLPGARPILALHGWLDNAATFTTLAPLLSADLVAVDLAGHGYSDHKSPQASYNLWDDLGDLLAIADQLGWQRFELLGHSRGAMMAMLLSAAYPQRITAVHLLDGFLPTPLAEQEFVSQLKRYLDQHSRRSLARPRGYRALDDAVQARRQVMPMSPEAARIILARNLVMGDQRWLWRTDPRLRFASAVKLTEGQCRAILAAIACPVNLLVAQQGLLADDMLAKYLPHPLIRVASLPGDHYFHLDCSAPAIADLIKSGPV